MGLLGMFVGLNPEDTWGHREAQFRVRHWARSNGAHLRQAGTRAAHRFSVHKPNWFVPLRVRLFRAQSKILVYYLRNLKHYISHCLRGPMDTAHPS